MVKVRQTKPATPKVVQGVAQESTTQTTQPETLPEKKQYELPQPDPLPNYDSIFKPIATYIHECDPQVEWPIVEKWLKTSPKTVPEALDMLNQQPDMMVRAMRLYLLAKREYVRFEIDWKDRTEILRSAARDFWENEKLAGMRKQITNDMIEDWIIEHYGDTYSAMKMRLQDMKNTKDLLEKLSQQIEAREPSLRRIVERMDKNTPAFLNPKRTEW